ncbi:MAG TPA: glycosyltransferase family 4 protein [Candidatus Acidoferrum sp.]|nr:glycosyltransferase family 4 protein [Candidatus Acidoferrum sp.]
MEQNSFLMKVLFISPGDPLTEPLLWAGIARSILDLMREEGLDVTLQVVPRTFAEKAMRMRRKLHWVGGRRGYELWSDPLVFAARGRALRKAIRGMSYDVVFSWMPWCLRLVDSSKPKLFWYDTTFVQTQPLYFANLTASSTRRCTAIDRRATEEAVCAIYSTKWAADSAVRDYGILEEKVRVLPFGPNLEAPTDTEMIQVWAARHKSRLMGIKCLFVGLDWKRKGGDVAVEAVRLLRSRNVNVELHIVGATPVLNGDDKTFVKCHGKLDKSKEPEREEMKRLYRESHIFVLPTRADSSPVAMSEAFAFGLPCIVSGNGGICQMVTQGVDGIAHQLSPHLASDVAHSIERLAQDTNAFELMAKAARSASRERFSWKRSGGELAKIIGNLG